MTAHAVGGSCVKAVGAEEAAGCVSCQDLPIEEHADHIGVTGAELHIVGHHDDGDTLLFQVGQNPGKGFLKEAVDALGRLVQKEQSGIGQQYFCQRRR